MVGLLLALIATPAASQTTLPDAKLLDTLVAAYPDFLERHEAGDIVWKDGTRTPLDDGKPAKDLDALFATPSLKDMFHWTYPLEAGTAGPTFPDDPGRIRVEAFFNRMYGDCTKGEVAPRLVSIAWLPKKKGGAVKVTPINGVAAKLAAVSADLDELPTSFDKFLVPSAGTYNCRPIAGSSRMSAHGHGIAIDLNTAHAHYWRWTKPSADGRYLYKNAIPQEIVRIFEKHGFIWGGKWHHYDTMHFEYRPEILAVAQ